VIRLGMTAVQAMEYFLANCDRVTLFSTGSSGIIFRCSLRAGTDSPYTSYRTGSFNRPITTVILKFVALTDVRQPGQPDRWYCEPERKNKNIEEVDLFHSEVNTQLEIFMKTFEYLDPVCPAPIYASIERDPVQAIHLLNDLLGKATDEPTSAWTRSIRDNVRQGHIPFLGILGMELAEGYTPLYKYCASPGLPLDDVRRVECMARGELVRLALETGYSQNDWHNSNVLFNPNAEGVYRGARGKVMLLDFGYATKIPPDILAIIRQRVSDSQYSAALDLFNTFVRADGVRIVRHSHLYGWLSNIWSNIHDKPGQLMLPRSINENMSVLATLQTRATRERVDFYAAARAHAPPDQRDSIPLLPLSVEEVKTRMFRGFEVVDDMPDAAAPAPTVDMGLDAATDTAAADDVNNDWVDRLVGGGGGGGGVASNVESGSQSPSTPVQAPKMQRIFNGTPPQPPESVNNSPAQPQSLPKDS